MIIEFVEESDYGQDVLELVAMCVELEEGKFNTTETRQRLKEIRGKVQLIEANLNKCEIARLEYTGLV